MEWRKPLANALAFISALTHMSIPFNVIFTHWCSCPGRGNYDQGLSEETLRYENPQRNFTVLSLSHEK